MKNKSLMKFMNKSSLDNIDRELEEPVLDYETEEPTQSYYDALVDEPIPAMQEGYSRSISKSMIAEGMIINGNVSTVGDLVIEGAVEGDVNCGGTLELNGKVKGLIQANQLLVNCSTIDGDITCGGNCHVSQDTVIKGNIKADSVTIDGRVEGNIFASGKLLLKGNGTLIGDCMASRFIIEDGAMVKGNLQTNIE